MFLKSARTKFERERNGMCAGMEVYCCNEKARHSVAVVMVRLTRVLSEGNHDSMSSVNARAERLCPTDVRWFTISAVVSYSHAIFGYCTSLLRI